MKYIFLCIALVVLAACGAGSKSVISPPSSIALKINERTTYDNLVITLKEVRESRCPMNARCIRAGEAVAVLNVVVGDKSERNIQLCTGADCRAMALNENYTFSIDDQKILFKLDSITPDPTKTLEKAEQRAYFSINPLK